jgi:DHA2 family multidrug resistance protein-like MFS transporter
MTSHAQHHARAGRREWIGLAVIALPCLVYAMDLTVLTLAVPSITADLRPSATELLWIADIYGFLVAGLLITMGVLGDRIGRRRLLFIGAAAFGVASVVAAFAASPGALIASRALLGVAGATVAPSTLSLIRNMFHDPRQRSVAVGIWVTSFSAGAAVGPLAGGLLLEHFWWGSVFLPAVPVMALLLAVGPRLLPEYREPEPGRIDLASVALSLVAVLAVVYGAKTVATYGVAPGGVAPILGGIAAGAAFLDRQRRLAAPMVDLALFRTPGFGPALGANTLAFAVVFGLEVLTAQYLQLVLGLSPLTAGLWGLPVAGAFIVGSQLTAPLAARLEPAPVMLGGLVIALVGAAALATAGTAGGAEVVVAGVTVLSLGLAPVFTLAADVAVGASPPERAGAAAGISETSSELGGALGIALLGTIGAAVYRGAMGDAPGEAGETLGGAVVAAERLPAALRPGALEPAREAFTQGLQVAATVSGAIIAAAALLVAGGLRRRGARSAAALAGASSGC